MSFGTKGCMYNCGDTCTCECMKPNQNNMTAIEWLVDKLDLNVFESDEEVADVIEQAKEMEREQNNTKIQKAIEKFEEAKSKASSLKDMMYLDGVLAILDTIKNETFKSE